MHGDKLSYTVSLIIPAFNEEKRIGNVLESYARVKKAGEIIVVANGCRDKTAEIASRLGAKVLVFENKLGKGGAIIEGFKAAEGEFIGFIDSDTSLDEDEFLRLLNTLKNSDFHGIIGSRWLEGAEISIRQPLKRRIASRAFNIIINALFNLGFKDTQCAAKIFRKNAIKSIVNDLKCKGYEFDVELLWKMKMKGYRIKEVPIKWRHDKDSKFSFIYIPEMLYNLIKLRLGR